MRILVTTLIIATGFSCGGCDQSDGEDPFDGDVAIRADLGADVSSMAPDGSTPDDGVEPDMHMDLGTINTDAGTDSGLMDTGSTPDGGSRCGNGILDPGENCDDGTGADCQGTRDGGNGECVPIGTCSDGFIMAGSQCVPSHITQHVHIYVANDCSMMVDPPAFEAPKGQTVNFEWHNHSQSYPVDVWQSYIGGYTDLAPGLTWSERHEWCFNVNPYVGYSDITTNEVCPSHRFQITCNGR